jgi:hypothetical protein
VSELEFLLSSVEPKGLLRTPHGMSFLVAKKHMPLASYHGHVLHPPAEINLPLAEVVEQQNY